jgi:hypothetical protein
MANGSGSNLPTLAVLVGVSVAAVVALYGYGVAPRRDGVLVDVPWPQRWEFESDRTAPQEAGAAPQAYDRSGSPPSEPSDAPPPSEYGPSSQSSGAPPSQGYAAPQQGAPHGPQQQPNPGYPGAPVQQQPNPAYPGAPGQQQPGTQQPIPPRQ